MIYRSKLYKSSPNGKTNILLGLISRNKLTLLLNVTIIIKTEKMQRNKRPSPTGFWANLPFFLGIPKKKSICPKSLAYHLKLF